MKTMKRIVLAMLAVCAVALLTLPAVTVRGQDDAAALAAIERNMIERHARAVEGLSKDEGRPVPPENVTIVDPSGWQYSVPEGLTFDPPGFVFDHEGSRPLAQERSGTDTDPCCFPCGDTEPPYCNGFLYGSFRRVVSNYWDQPNSKGYAHVEGKVTLPSRDNFCGVNRTWDTETSGPEHAWIYLGLRRPPVGTLEGGGSVDFEAGLYSRGPCESPSDSGFDKAWKLYSKRAGSQMQVLQWPQDQCWPQGGLAPGTTVWIALKVWGPGDEDNVDFRVQPAGCNDYQHWVFDVPYADRAGDHQVMRRVSSLVVSPCPCGCGDPDETTTVYGYLKEQVWGAQNDDGQGRGRIKLAYYSGASWYKSDWTSGKTWTVAGDDNYTWNEPDDCAECASVLDFVDYTSHTADYHETIKYLRPYCNPTRYSGDCTQDERTCPWPFADSQNCQCAY